MSRQDTAYHEAGHALVAARSVWLKTPSAVLLHPTGGGSTRGATPTPEALALEDRTPVHREAARLLLAGAVADRIVGRPSLETAEGDFDALHEVMRSHVAHRAPATIRGDRENGGGALGKPSRALRTPRSVERYAVIVTGDE